MAGTRLQLTVSEDIFTYLRSRGESPLRRPEQEAIRGLAIIIDEAIRQDRTTTAYKEGFPAEPGQARPPGPPVSVCR
jgi:hypothetical protein